MDDVYVYYVQLPDGIEEAVLPCFDGYTIYIDHRLSQQGREAAYQHAIEHINRNDFERAEIYGIQQIESEAHVSGGKNEKNVVPFCRNDFM